MNGRDGQYRIVGLWCLVLSLCGLACSCAAPRLGAEIPGYPSLVQRYIDRLDKHAEVLQSVPLVVEAAMNREIEKMSRWRWDRLYGKCHRVCFKTSQGYCLILWKLREPYMCEFYPYRFDLQGHLLPVDRTLE